MVFAEFCVVIAAMLLGARFGGVFFGMAGGIGVLALTVVFGLAPGTVPMDVMLIMTSVVLAASCLQSSGGMAFLVRVAERLLRSHPKSITFMAPLVSWGFTFCAGSSHVLYCLLPVIAEVSREAGVRPERPISISVIAAQHGVPTSPISAASAAMVALLAAKGVSVMMILAVVLPATLIGIVCGALAVCRLGKELADDEDYQARVRMGVFERGGRARALGTANAHSAGARTSVWIFFAAAILVVLVGTFPELRPAVRNAAGELSRLSTGQMIEIVMLTTGGLMVVFCKAEPGDVIRTSVFRSGMTGVIMVFGLAWMADTWTASNLALIESRIAEIVAGRPYIFALALFVVSVVTNSQGVTVAAMMPLGVSLGLEPKMLVAMYPAVCGQFVLPSTGVLLAGVAFDESGTTRIGKAVFNHSFMVPGLVTMAVTVAAALAIQAALF